jgi:hypothetical protein
MIPFTSVRQLATSCSTCATPLLPADVLYSDEGQVVCQACSSAREVQASLQRSADAFRGLAYGNLLLGIGSLLFDPFFILSIAAVGNGIYVLRRLRADARGDDAVPDATGRAVASGIGMALAGLGVLVRLMR